MRKTKFRGESYTILLRGTRKMKRGEVYNFCLGVKEEKRFNYVDNVINALTFYCWKFFKILFSSGLLIFTNIGRARTYR